MPGTQSQSPYALLCMAAGLIDVQCDATDSTSCTECSSRNVKCQFTKETNRRMSNQRSVYYNPEVRRPNFVLFNRHNQDLQKELAHARSQVNHLQSMIASGKDDVTVRHVSAAYLPSPEPAQNHNLSHLPNSEFQHTPYVAETFLNTEQRQPKRRKTASTMDYSDIGANMQEYGRGIFKLPYSGVRGLSLRSVSSSPAELPPKYEADRLMTHYQSNMHQTLPMIHWPSFRGKYELVYRNRSLEQVPREWIALLYAVFACGTLHRSWKDGQKYLEISRSFTDLWIEDYNLDHVRTALLSTIFLIEMNLKSAGWTYLGCAVRMCFDIGLHCEAGSWSAIEEEMRRRVWWCVYSCDW